MALDVPYKSIPDMFLKRVASTPDKDALGYPTGTGASEKVAWLTWAQVAERAKAIAAGLRSLGISNEDRVAILSNTRVEWVIADLGIMCAGGATTTVYPTTEADDAAYIISDSGSKVLIAENPQQAAKLEGASLPGLERVVLIDGEPKAGASVPQMTLAELERVGREKLAAEPALISTTVE
ncbi:MAG TPA: AMP-binding protein, partial [Kofleriaceae bacterium]|nr:AMP-binding protein [Kofleriaceae bacterium]